MIYQHPLGYLLGMQGRALLRAFAGEFDREFTMARLAEVRALLDAVDNLGEGGYVSPFSTVDGYQSWAPFYDSPGNALVEREGPRVHALLDRVLRDSPTRTVLDAACGTGRHAAHLAAGGHRVIGIDSSPAMLDIARSKLPDAELHQADLHGLPLPDDDVDLIVCGLALAHVPDLAPVFAEFARVLRPGGTPRGLRLPRLRPRRTALSDRGHRSRWQARIYRVLDPFDQLLSASRPASRFPCTPLRGTARPTTPGRSDWYAAGRPVADRALHRRRRSSRHLEPASVGADGHERRVR
jgi:ubiquinone/menaquinone biosynthesis C-methylase UbiE